MESKFNDLWEKCLKAICKNIPEKAFETWFKPIVPLDFEKGTLTLQVPSNFYAEYIEANYLNVLKDALNQFAGEGTKLRYRIPSDASAANQVMSSPQLSNKNEQETKTLPNSGTQEIGFNPNLNPKYKFENYFEGTSNRLVRSIGETIAREPGSTAFNPLFIYGQSGVGKTHLCNAIGARIRQLHPNKRVLYISAHLFRMQFTDSMLSHKSNDFLRFYQSIDVLILDDIQELVGMTKTQNTFFHIFNHLHRLNKQLILTSDKAPVDLNGMENRLITRLKWGMTAEMEQPDINLRKRIVEHMAKEKNLIIPSDVMDFIIQNVTDNVRDIEGIIISLLANSIINNNKSIDLSLAKKIVSQTVHLSQKKITIDSIQSIVCDYYHLDPSAIQGKSRKSEISSARQVTMYLAKKHTGASFSNIGKLVGKRDHATVLHACKTIRNLLETDKEFRSSVEELEMRLKS